MILLAFWFVTLLLLLLFSLACWQRDRWKLNDARAEIVNLELDNRSLSTTCRHLREKNALMASKILEIQKAVGGLHNSV